MNKLLEKPDWRRLSFSERVPWTEALIEYYKNNWDWYWLSINESLPWSIELIEKYKDRWEWGRLIPDEKGEIIQDWLSDNAALP